MSFLTPLFFLGLAAIAVPILVHLIQRERKHVVEFPSLMFVQKIPYQSVRRRRIRHWFLLLMRAAAIALIVAAFARPFFPQGAAAVAAAGGNREVVILLDQSASMGYGDHWQRARDAARDAVGSLGTGDRATLVLFGRNAEENMRATSDRGRLEARSTPRSVTSGATRYGPALKLAESILSRSTLPRREAILISDFQKSGWTGAEDVHSARTSRSRRCRSRRRRPPTSSVPSVTFAPRRRSRARSASRSPPASPTGAPEPAPNVPVTLEIDGRADRDDQTRQHRRQRVGVGRLRAVHARRARGARRRSRPAPIRSPPTTRSTSCSTPSQPVSVLVVDGGDARRRQLLPDARRSASATRRRSRWRRRRPRASRRRRSTSARSSSSTTRAAARAAGGVLKRFVERGGGLLVAFGERSAWPASEADLLPGKLGADRRSHRAGAAATIGFRDYSHPVFEVFKAPRSGDFSAARVSATARSRPAPDDRVLARFDDGAVAAAERRVGTGRVIAWTTTLDDAWNDLRAEAGVPAAGAPARPVPGAATSRPPPWRTVGQVVDLSALLKGRAERVVMTPSASAVDGAGDEPGVLELNEQGVYEVRAAASARRPRRPDCGATSTRPSRT